MPSKKFIMVLLIAAQFLLPFAAVGFAQDVQSGAASTPVIIFVVLAFAYCQLRIIQTARLVPKA